MQNQNIVYDSLKEYYTDDNIREARHRLWRMGCLVWKLSITQKKIYDFYHGTTFKTTVVNASRRLGKSYGLVIMAIEECLQRENITVIFLQPEVKMIRSNIIQIFDEVLVDCPKDLIPKYTSHDSVYNFNNGSKIKLAGTDNKNYDKLRGGQCHLAIIDEAGFCTDLKHIIKYILTPTTLRTKGRIILSSTTPPQPDHEFITYMKSAEEQGRLIRKTIFDARDDDKNSDSDHRITDEMIADVIKELDRGEDDDSFKTEYLCDVIFNSDTAVVGEFTKAVQQDVIAESRRPVYCDRYVSMDIGFRDLTAILFGFYDFDNGLLVIEDELILSRDEVTAANVSKKVFEKEDALWRNRFSGEIEPIYKRVSDNNLIFINDLSVTYGLNFIATEKQNKHAYINKMKTMIAARRIIINPKCKHLISHLQHATWNKTKDDYLRSDDNGHYDCVDALAYMVRNLDETHNPYPNGYAFSKLGPKSSYFINPNYNNTTNNETFNKFNNMFKKKRKGS